MHHFPVTSSTRSCIISPSLRRLRPPPRLGNRARTTHKPAPCCARALRTCPAHVPCARALRTCPAHVLCARALRTCPAHVPCARALRTCSCIPLKNGDTVNMLVTVDTWSRWTRGHGGHVVTVRVTPTGRHLSCSLDPYWASLELLVKWPGRLRVALRRSWRGRQGLA